MAGNKAVLVQRFAPHRKPYWRGGSIQEEAQYWLNSPNNDAGSFVLFIPFAKCFPLVSLANVYSLRNDLFSNSINNLLLLLICSCMCLCGKCQSKQHRQHLHTSRHSTGNDTHLPQPSEHKLQSFQQFWVWLTLKYITVINAGNWWVFNVMFSSLSLFSSALPSTCNTFCILFLNAVIVCHVKYLDHDES